MKDILEQLFSKHYLTCAQARALLLDMAAGRYAPAQTAAFLTVFRMRTPCVEELEGFRAALLDLCVRVDLGGVTAVDLVGTGGDGKNTFNISTLAALVTAGAGQPVVKHGNYASSSVSGASNVLEELGVRLAKTPEDARVDLDRCGFCYLHAPYFHPAMKQIAPIRKELGVRTFFNLLGPLVNPASPSHQMIGVAQSSVLRLYHYLLQKMGVKYVLVHALDGYDEFSLTGASRIVGSLGERLLEPCDLGLQVVSPAELSGGKTPAEAARIFVRILEGQGSAAQERIVAANAALALQLTGRAQSAEDGFFMALEALKSGRALGVLKRLSAARG